MRPRLAIASLFLVLGFHLPARAIVLLGGTGTEQFTNPGSGLPWANVGNVGGASGVYLGDFGGNYWVLTASHVVGSGSSLANLVLDSGTHIFVPGSGVVVRNGDNSVTDLTLFRISTNPGLTNLTISSTAPVTSATVMMVGRGGIEGGANYWSVSVQPGASDDIWTDLGGNPTGSNASGYLLAGSAGKRWGQNAITNTSNYNVGTGNTAAFYTTFQNVGGSAQAAAGDSGGATFYNNGSSWELAGILGAVGGFVNQPGSTALLGNVSFSASIASYNSFITSAIPEPSTYAALAGLLALGAVVIARRRKGSSAANTAL